MPTKQSGLSKWIFIISGLFALLEIMVSFSIALAPESVVHDSVDLNAKGVSYLTQTWAVRQFALGIIFAFAAYKRSGPMLTLAYIFFFVMMAGDILIGVFQKNNGLIVAASAMAVAAAAMIFAINKRR